MPGRWPTTTTWTPAKTTTPTYAAPTPSPTGWTPSSGPSPPDCRRAPAPYSGPGRATATSSTSPSSSLIPVEGTPLGGEWQLTPQRCLRILALFRFFFPDVEVRIAGGREIHLRTLQPLALHIANSIFLGDYLTSEGQPGGADLEMIADSGFVVEGMADQTLPDARHDLVTVRRRGPGTSEPANV